LQGPGERTASVGRPERHCGGRGFIQAYGMRGAVEDGAVVAVRGELQSDGERIRVVFVFGLKPSP
jgi:hypothetical protein